ncbi:hypothetical protein [Luteibaculum oceani]|uniref:Lipoprotein n=1 Tax=Luteibaculum oceani TaxID=1294296 RepID=A0A5C6US86_9FLAO|nr:hypothetical protein [Luteibaculum oceani]TXC76097.1 hypothetical protein FRX97_11335 [Luteibaculum oceani]
MKIEKLVICLPLLIVILFSCEKSRNELIETTKPMGIVNGTTPIPFYEEEFSIPMELSAMLGYSSEIRLASGENEIYFNGNPAGQVKFKINNTEDQVIFEGEDDPVAEHRDGFGLCVTVSIGSRAKRCRGGVGFRCEFMRWCGKKKPTKPLIGDLDSTLVADNGRDIDDDRSVNAEARIDNGYLILTFTEKFDF